LSALPAVVYFYTVNASNACNTSASSVEVSAPLMITSSLRTSTNWITSGWGGAAGGAYHLRSTTNPRLPRTGWSALIRNSFGPAGGFSFTNAIDPGEAQRYFMIQTLP